MRIGDLLHLTSWPSRNVKRKRLPRKLKINCSVGERIGETRPSRHNRSSNSNSKRNNSMCLYSSKRLQTVRTCL